VSRVAVIGAGVAGLAVAARLGAAGHRVTLFESAAVVGGKLGRYEQTGPAGTFRFDTGPSLLTLPQVFAELFAATGARLADELELVPLDPVVRHVFADGTVLDSSPDPTEFTERIAAALGPGAADDWRVLWRRAARVWDASWRDVLTAPLDSPRSLLRLAWRVGDLAAIAPGRSLRSLGRQHLRDPRLRMLLERYATYAGADPRRAPAALAAIPYAELAFGGWYLAGGLGTLADALLRRCLARGVRVRTAAAVARVEAAGGAVTGVRLASGEPVRADVVVSAVDALHLYRDLLPDAGRVGRLADRSLAGFVLLLGLRPGASGAAPGGGGAAGGAGGTGTGATGGPGARRGPARHTVYFPAGRGPLGGNDAEFDEVFGAPGHGRPARPATDPAVFVSAATDPVSCPDRHEAWFVLVNAPGQGPVEWRRPGLAGGYADHILEILARRGAEVRDRVAVRAVRTPADLQDATGSPGGAIYGTAAHRLLRPANRGPVRGLYLVGGSTHPGGGLPLVALSARIVAERIGPA
jgi:phytoene dehydrogenase-like protein